MVKTKAWVVWLLIPAISVGLISVLASCHTVTAESYVGTTIIVPDNYARIEWAIGNASSGDTVLVRSGNYSESEIVVDKAVKVVGENPETTVLDGQRTARYVFQVIASNTIIENFTLQNTDPAVMFSSAVRMSYVQNVIVEHVIVVNVNCGVEVLSSNFTRIESSRFSNSTSLGVYVHSESNNNTIRANFFDGTSSPIYIASNSSKFTRVHHNNFVNNTNQVLDFGFDSTFDDGYPSGGNYWSDHAAADASHGSGQNITGSDGILDEAYPSPTSPEDRYPFAHPSSSIPIHVGESTFEVDVSTNCSMVAYSFNPSGKSLDFLVEAGADGFQGFRAAIPKSLLSCANLSDWTISTFKQGTGGAIQYLALEDYENTYFFFTFNDSAVDRIEIKGTMALSEFGVASVLTLLAASSLVLAAVKKVRKTTLRERVKTQGTG